MIHTIRTLRGSTINMCLAAGLAGYCANAQTETIETELPPVVVSAHNSIDIPYDRTGVSVTLLDAQEERKAGRYTLLDALKRVPGVSIHPGGGNTANICIRGMSSATATLPLVDGMRVFNSTGSSNLTANVLGRANMFDIGHVEILRGAEGATYGGGAMGGVVNLETPEGQDEPSGSIFSEFGSFNSLTGNVRYQGKSGNTGFFLSSTYERSNKRLRYDNGHRPQAKHADKYVNYSQALRLDQGVAEATTLTLTYRREDAVYNYYSPDPYYGGITPYTFRTNLLTAKLKSMVTEAWTSSLMAGYFGNDYMFGHGNYYDTRNVQVEWRNAYKWCEHHTTSAGLAWLRSQYDGTNNGERTPYGGLENTYSIFAEYIYTPTDQWDNSLAVRLDQSNLFDSLFTARAASSYRFNQEKTRLLASVGSGYRAPGDTQRSNSAISWYGTTYHGNPQLECEHSYSADLGIEHQWTEGHYLSATCFLQRKENAISERTEYNPNTWSADTYFYNDAGHWLIQGVELSLHGEWDDAWQSGYRITATLTRPKTAQDKQIDYSARQTWAADVYTGPIEGLTTGIGLVATMGRTFATRADNYYTLRWYADYAVSKQLRLHLRVENLTNQKYCIEPGYGSGNTRVPDMLNTGLGIYGGCTLTF